VAFGVASPILIYNLQHDFEPLLFQWRHATVNGESGLKPFAEFFGIQILLFGTMPVVLYPWVVWNFRRFALNPRLRACASLYAVPMTFFLYKATRSELEGNWGLVMFVGFWPFAEAWYAKIASSRLWRWLTAAAFLPPAICSVFLAIHLVSPLPFIPPGKDRISEQPAVWRAVRAVSDEIRRRDAALPVYAPTYQLTARLRYLGVPARQIDGASRPSHFTHPPQHLTDVDDAWVVGWQLPETLAKGFGSPEEALRVPLVVRGLPHGDLRLLRYTRSSRSTP
jgi:hypothetical protein